MFAKNIDFRVIKIILQLHVIAAKMHFDYISTMEPQKPKSINKLNFKKLNQVKIFSRNLNFYVVPNIYINVKNNEDAMQQNKSIILQRVVSTWLHFY